MKNAIVTGCEGQLGTIFIEELFNLGFKVIGIDKEQKKSDYREFWCNSFRL